MGGRWCTSLLLLIAATAARSLDFNITTTWDGKPIGNVAPVQLRLNGSPDGEFLEVSVIAPFFDDPPPPGAAGELAVLWRYEVVEAFFLNDDDQYFQIQLSPHGQYSTFLYNASREKLRYYLPLKTMTQINTKTSTWTSLAKIPLDYLPPNITKFNAYAIHGIDPSRNFWSLYPADETLSRPDFHALQFFKEVDFSQVMPNIPEEMSQLWADAMEGIFRYHIKTEWNSRPVSHEPVEIKLQGFEAGVEMNVTAPFFNNTKPDGPAGEPFYGLWDYEVVEMFFLNDNEEYLEVEVGPWGQHLLLLLNGARNAIKHSMPLDYIAERPESTDGKWTGSAMIPPEYFPPNVTRMNAYAIHGTGDNRVYESLYPAPENDPEFPQADFHRLELFQPIDFVFQMPNNNEYSQLWLDAMDSTESSSTDISPVVKNEEEVEVTTTLGFRDEGEVLVTTIVPDLRENERDDESSLRKTPQPHKVEVQPPLREQRLENDQAAFDEFFVPPLSPVPRPHRVRGTAPGRFQDRVLEDADQRFPQGSGAFQGQGASFETPAFQDPRFPSRDQQLLDSKLPPRESQPQGSRFPPREPLFQDQGRPLPTFQEQGQFAPPQPFLGQGQQQFQNPLPVQNQREQVFQPPRPFRDQDQQQFVNPQIFQDQREQAPRPIQNQPQRQQFESIPETPFQEEDQPRPFQSQGQQEFLPPLPGRDQRPEQFPQEERRPSQDLALDVPGTQSSQAFNPPLVRDEDLVASPEVEAAIQTLSQGLASLPPPHPICFEPGLVPDPDRCYAFHECVLENGVWELYSWRCRRGHVFDPVNVACVRGRCSRRRRTG